MPVLYNLPVLKTTDPSVTVWVCEGEKDADRLGSYDLVTTTNPMGAGKWRDEYSETLCGRAVAILPDNDEPGRKHAREVAQSLQGKAVSVKVVELPGLPQKGDVSDWLDAGGTVERLRELLRETSEWMPAPTPEFVPVVSTTMHAGNNGVTGAGDRPAIEITTEWHIVVDQAVQALARDPDLFRRGSTLGHVVVEEEPTLRLSQGVELRNAHGTSRFIGHSDPAIGRCLTRNAQFFKWRKDQNGEDVAVNVNPPDWLIKNVATMEYWPGIRTLRSITGCPYVNPDGSIPNPGFDQATGTLYRPIGKTPAIPSHPNQQDARDAADRLLGLVDQFPFATGADRSVFLAGLLTAIQRPAIDGPVPGVVFNGNKAGVGKGLLVDTIGLIAWGHSIPTRTYPADPIEAGKVKLSLAMSGISAVHFDNLPEGGFFGNSELDSALTSTEVEGRILGQSRESGPLSLRPCWFISGNNVSPSKDAYRRWLPCNLQTDLESPHERDDIKEGNLRGHIRDNRLELLNDALVVLKAYAIAGRPKGRWATLGSFEDWDKAVRGAVWFATGDDCLATQRAAAEESQDRQDKLALLEGWRELLRERDGGLTVQEALQEVADYPDHYSMLRSVLLRMSRDGKMPTPQQIGIRIAAMKSQPIGGLRFRKCGDKNHAVLWMVATV